MHSLWDQSSAILDWQRLLESAHYYCSAMKPAEDDFGSRGRPIALAAGSGRPCGVT